MRRRIAGRKASSSPSEPSARRGAARRIGSRKSHAFQRSASVGSFVTSASAAPTSVRYACRMARGILADDTRRPSPSKSAVDDEALRDASEGRLEGRCADRPWRNGSLHLRAAVQPELFGFDFDVISPHISRTATLFVVLVGCIKLIATAALTENGRAWRGFDLFAWF